MVEHDVNHASLPEHVAAKLAVGGVDGSALFFQRVELERADLGVTQHIQKLGDVMKDKRRELTSPVYICRVSHWPVVLLCSSIEKLRQLN